jgi:hypothetical protein
MPVIYTFFGIFGSTEEGRELFLGWNRPFLGPISKRSNLFLKEGRGLMLGLKIIS